MVSYFNVKTVFHALGDETRLGIVAQLAAGEPRRVSDIAEGFVMTRPAISKHLNVLETAGIVQTEWRGREKYCHLRPENLREAKDWIDRHERLWRGALDDLAAYFTAPHKKD